MYLKRKIWNAEREVQINKMENSRSATVATKGQKALKIVTGGAGKLSRVVSELPRRLDRREDLSSNISDRRSIGSDRLPPLESGADESWGPGPDPGRPRARSEAPRSEHEPSIRSTTRRKDVMPPQRSGDEERDKWLSADYGRRGDPVCIPVEPKRPRHDPEPAPLAYGVRYGALLDKVPEEDMEWDIEGQS